MAGQAVLGETILQRVDLSSVTAVALVESLVSDHMPMVFRISYSILRNHHDAEDATQECFLKALRIFQRSGGAAEIRNSKTWLARVAWTTALDRRSRRAAVGEFEIVSSVFDGAAEDEQAGALTLDGFPDSRIRQDELLAGREMQQAMEKLMATLPEDLRQPLELSTVQELNSGEIAELMEIPEGSVRTRLMRARRLLKEKMAMMMEVKKHG